MPEARRSAAPWIAAGVAAVLFAGALLLFLLTDPADSDSNDSGAQAFSSAEKEAVTSAGTETANLLSFRRAHFEDDFKRALAGATGDILKDIRSKKAATLATMTKGKFDLSAKVTHSALVGPVENDKVTGYVVLVSLDGFRSTQKNLPTQQNLEVTVVKQKGEWLVSGVRNIGVGA